MIMSLFYNEVYIITLLYLFTYLHISLATGPLNTTNSYSVTLRPGAVFFPQFVSLTSHIYQYINFSSNGTALNEYLSEKDYANPEDKLPRFQFYLNTETGYVYYVDGDNCVKTSMSYVSIFCLYVPSYITSLFLNGFFEDGYTFNKSFTECPFHTEIPCDKWYAKEDDITLYAKGNILEAMVLSGILYKPMVHDDFKPTGAIPENFIPKMECKETDSFPLCELNNKEMKFNHLKSKMENLLGL
ncbi:hypothetical protein LOD99_14279 [Oopsacas minuta]|uniref:Uncharacterized protein n=1 Tax=Oopsacas minuta TaxID=111878 RepID=A0AAV7KFQ8_9METZ|nr:hypothetical protein LOD99_14279 [Oopsacas minuta]